MPQVLLVALALLLWSIDMATIGIIENNTIVNAILADADYIDPEKRETVVMQGQMSIGWIREQGNWIDPSPFVPVSNDDLRKAAYANESDPIYFKWQAGEASKEDWLAKREEIRQRHQN